MKTIEDLEIIKQSFSLALECRELSLRLNYPDKTEVGSQLRRSSQSI